MKREMRERDKAASPRDQLLLMQHRHRHKGLVHIPNSSSSQQDSLIWSCLQLANTNLLEWHPVQNQEPQRKILQLQQGFVSVTLS